jgi:hypothetical protein
VATPTISGIRETVSRESENSRGKAIGFVKRRILLVIGVLFESNQCLLAREATPLRTTAREKPLMRRLKAGLKSMSFKVFGIHFRQLTQTR